MAKKIVEFDIYLPMKKIEQSRLKPKITGLRKSLVKYFGGLTDTRHENKGFWKIQNITMKDEIVIWKILSDRGVQGETFLRVAKTKLEKILQEKEILITKVTVWLL